jgi:hypothetical protein
MSSTVGKAEIVGRAISVHRESVGLTDEIYKSLRRKRKRKETMNMLAP